MNCKVCVTNLTTGVLAYILQNDVKNPEYIVRAYREDNKVAFHVVMQYDTRECIGVSHLLSSSEEELFQLACTAPYDVYYVLKSIHVLHEKIMMHDDPVDVQTTKEDIVLQY